MLSLSNCQKRYKIRVWGKNISVKNISQKCRSTPQFKPNNIYVRLHQIDLHNHIVLKYMHVFHAAQGAKMGQKRLD